MYRGYNEFPAFGLTELSEYLLQREKELVTCVQREDDDYILSVGEDAYIQHLLEKWCVEPLRIFFESITIETTEREIEADHFPSGYSVEWGKSYPKTVLIYRVPFEGDQELLRMQPGSRLLSGSTLISIEVAQQNKMFIKFDNVVFNENDHDVQKEYLKQVIKELKSNQAWQAQDISVFNARLPGVLGVAFDAQKEKILKKRDLVKAIGVPINSTNDASVFVVPPPEQRQRISVKPSSSSIPFTPEPTLDEATYGSILKLIETTGINMERAPSLYEKKDEESLRDLFLMVLQTHFQGSASAEAFNVTGKTDILFKHEAANLFVAECKIWRGEGQVAPAIDQLLGYLTYRDSKTALLFFIKNKDFQSTVRKMLEATRLHTAFIIEKNLISEHGAYCRFKLPTDENKEISTALMAFHFPEK